MKRIQIRKEDIKEYLKQRKERRQQILEKRRNSKFAKKMQPVYKWMNRFSLPLHFLLSCVINVIIEAISRHSLGPALDYMVSTPWTFLYNTYMIFITFLLVYLVRRRVFFRIIITVFWLVIGCVNGYMLSVRVTPFNAQDLKVIDDAMSMIDKYFTGPQGAMLITLIVAIIAWLVSMWRRGGQFTGKMYRIPALIVVVAAFGTMSFVTDLAIEKRVVSNYFGNIAFAYEDYGLPYCFTASLFNTGISEPNAYNGYTINEITQGGKLKESTTGRKEMPNIITIQLESFFDVYEAEFFTTSMDPIPTFHYLMENYSTGYCKVPSVGAGTANTEFEVLTGMSMRYFGPGEYPYKTTLKEGYCESAATALAELGYGTHALHNNGGNFYSRAKVFNNIGFDSYTSKEFMNILQLTENGWAKDDILVEHIVNAMDSTQQQDFVFGISVQGHGEYPTERLIEQPEIFVHGIEDTGKRNKWEYYVNQVYEMDAFAGKLVETLDQREEPTVVVFYGDHLPTMGLKAEDLKSRYLYNTNYVIWDNIGLEKEDRNVPSYQLMADVFERLDIHSGTVFNYHQERRQTDNYLSDLELLQFDILFGSQYAYNGDSPITEGHMKMGIKDVTLSHITEQLGGTYSLYGTNFTKWSKVYLNGEKQSSKFLNNTRIELKEMELNEGDILTVSQVGSSNTIFRTTDQYVFSDGKLNVIEGTGTNTEISWIGQGVEEE